MKTAEQWMMDIGQTDSENFNVESAMKGDFSMHPCKISVMTAGDIKAIQLDAMKSCAEIAHKASVRGARGHKSANSKPKLVAREIEQSILTAAQIVKIGE